MAMVVKNNMSAIATLNTLNKNSSALSKSLAKVSSGMKINSAADDASGYAISERMRVQIRSLDQANQNTQNGNSMMKTAEGAVSSTVEILKTLKQKVINAANDTNTDNDRKTIQKELNQSIDQIDDNALVTFNGKYLVDGSKNMAGSATYTALTNKSLSTSTTADTKLTDLMNRNDEDLEINETDKVTVSYVTQGKTYSATFQVGDSTLRDVFQAAEDIDKDSQIFADKGNKSITAAEAEQSKTELAEALKATDAAKVDNDRAKDALRTAVDALKTAISDYNSAATAATPARANITEDLGGDYSGDNLGTLFTDLAALAGEAGYAGYKNGFTDSGTGATPASTEIGTEITAVVNALKAYNGYNGSDLSSTVADMNIKTGGTLGTYTTAKTKSDDLQDAANPDARAEDVSTAKALVKDYKTVTADVEEKGKDVVKQANALSKAIDTYNAGADLADQMIVVQPEEDITEIDKAIAYLGKVAKDGNYATFKATAAGTAAVDAVDTALTAYSGKTMAAGVAGADAAEAATLLDPAEPTGGAKQAYLTLAQKYTDYEDPNDPNNDATDETKAALDVKYETALKTSGPKLMTGSYVGLSASNDLVQTADGTNAITVTAKNSGLAGQISGFNISIADSEGNVKKSANAALDSWGETVRAQNESANNALNFQVGAAANQAITVGLTDMRSEALGLKGADGTKLNISTQVKANAAVNVLDNALQKALDQQTTIGSIESRLDYTSSNLTTSSENVQASESTIRDADMAKEMTEYTKNNVLLQAAQSMLAQANQNSSAVLSLLQ